MTSAPTQPKRSRPKLTDNQKELLGQVLLILVAGRRLAEDMSATKIPPGLRRAVSAASALALETHLPIMIAVRTLNEDLRTFCGDHPWLDTGWTCVQQPSGQPGPRIWRSLHRIALRAPDLEPTIDVTCEAAARLFRGRLLDGATRIGLPELADDLDVDGPSDHDLQLIEASTG